mgnify:CR=1 FL=1
MDDRNLGFDISCEIVVLIEGSKLFNNIVLNIACIQGFFPLLHSYYGTGTSNLCLKQAN